MTKEKIIRINEIAMRCLNAGPVSLETGIERIREIVNGVMDEPREALRPREETLLELQRAIHDLACEKGWWDGYDRDDQWRLKLTTDQVISKIALIHAELSEAVEEARKSNDHGMYLGEGGKPEGFAVELADVLIRTLDLFGALGIDAADIVRIKHEYNRTRPHRHGGKLA